MKTQSRMFSLVSTLAVSILVSGCAMVGAPALQVSRIGAFTIASTKDVKVNAKEVGARVEGKHDVIWYFGIASLEQAIDNAIEKSPGADALIDVVIYVYSYQLPEFYRWGFKVEGTPVSTKSYSLLKEAKPLVTGKNIKDVYEIVQFIEVE